MTLEFQSGASLDHLPFIIEALLAAERVPLGTTMYESIFGLSDDELRAFLSPTLMQDAPGRPLSLSAFRVLLAGTEPVACCAAWIEPLDGMASGAWSAIALSRHLGLPRFRACANLVRVLADVSPKRTPGALQLESFFVRSGYRGRGLTRRLIEESWRAADDSVVTSEISLLQENAPALTAYMAAGFAEKWRSAPGNEAFVARTGSRGFVQLSRAR